MAKQNNHYNTIPETNANHFWLTRPPPPLFMPSQPMTPTYRMPSVHPHVSLYNQPAKGSTVTLPYSCHHISNQNYQDQYISNNQNIISTSFPVLPDNIDQEYILRYLCPVHKGPKDETTVWIENWLISKGNDIALKNVKSTNVEINEISNKVKECKILLENINNNKLFMEQNISIMTDTEWKKSCSKLSSDKEQLDIILKSLNLDDNCMAELKLKLSKRKKKRNRLKRLKSDLKIIKTQQKDEIREINRKIDAWQNTFKENILNEKREKKAKIEANIVLKGVRGKIDDAKNQIVLLDNLEKLRKCRLQNCVNKRKNPILEESLNKLKELWQQKLTEYNKEEEELKNMLSKAEAKKHEKRGIEIQEKLSDWDRVLFGPDFRSHEILFDNLHTFLDIRKYWDKYVVDENETPTSSSIPVGWIIPSVPCNSDWAKYSNNVL